MAAGRERPGLRGKENGTRVATVMSITAAGNQPGCAVAPTEAARGSEALIRAFYHARAEQQPLDDFLTADVVWEVPGHSLIAGMYRGHRDVLRYIALREDLAAATVSIDVHDIIAGEHTAVMFSTSHAVRCGETFDSRGAALFKIRDGRIARCRLFPADQNAFDSFWS